MLGDEKINFSTNLILMNFQKVLFFHKTVRSCKIFKTKRIFLPKKFQKKIANFDNKIMCFLTKHFPNLERAAQKHTGKKCVCFLLRYNTTEQ